MRARAFAIVGLCTLAIPAIAATIETPEYRECMRAAIDERDQALIGSLREYNDRNEEALDERRARYAEAYDAETDGEIRERTRDADSEYGRRLTDLKREKRERDRDATERYGDARKACRDLRQSQRRPIKHPVRPSPSPCYAQWCLR